MPSAPQREGQHSRRRPGTPQCGGQAANAMTISGYFKPDGSQIQVSSSPNSLAAEQRPSKLDKPSVDDLPITPASLDRRLYPDSSEEEHIARRELRKSLQDLRKELWRIRAKVKYRKRFTQKDILMWWETIGEGKKANEEDACRKDAQKEENRQKRDRESRLRKWSQTLNAQPRFSASGY